MSPDPSLKKGSPVLQFTVMLESRVGALNGVVKLIQECHAEVLGVKLAESSDVTLARIVVTDPDIVMQQFLERGIPHCMLEIVVVELKDGVSSLPGCLSVLLQAETNIHSCYSLLVRSDRDHPLVAFHLEDTEFAVSLLEKQGFKILCQEDLSR